MDNNEKFDMSEFSKEAEPKEEKKATAKSKSSINYKMIISIVIAVILVIIIVPSGIYCAVNKETPKQVIVDTFSSSEDQLVGKWQGATGVSAYEFKEDGTYISYISSFDFSGTYTIKGNKLTLFNAASNGNVVYKVKVNSKSLTLTLIEENGVESEEKDEIKLDRVDTIRTRTLSDIIDDYTTTTKDAK
ncbi:MAG: DUF5640 domain-containing protein [Eubacteriales bacterium]|nr:DUF5640 domain-containing protein [Eubacteriales bacterium]